MTPSDPALLPPPWQAMGFTPYGRAGFEAHIGPLFGRLGPLGPEFLAQVQPQHCNHMQQAHGGFLLALADTFLSGTCILGDQVEHEFVTVDLSHDFLGSAPCGAWLHVHGHLRKHGRSLMFVDCRFDVDGETMGVSRCVMKKINRLR